MLEPIANRQIKFAANRQKKPVENRRKPINFWLELIRRNIPVLYFDSEGKEVKDRWAKITEARIRAEIEQNLQQERQELNQRQKTF